MSKRQAGVQITKDGVGREDDDDDRHGPPDPAEVASADVLATRKIAMPKSRKKAEEPASNPFKFGAVSASNPFGSIASSAATPFGNITPSTATKEPENVFGTVTSSTTSKEQTSDANDEEYQSLLKLRSLNVAFRNAVQACLDNDAFADLSTICKEYATHKEGQKEPSVPEKQSEPEKTIQKSGDFTWTPDKPIKFAEEKKEPSFNFNNPMTSPVTASKPAGFGFGGTGFSFGQTETKKADDKPAFSFGTQKSDDKPADKASFSFGTQKSDDKPTAASSDKPTFSFGSQKSDDKPADKSAFSFGTQKSAEPTDKPANKPAFSFGTAAPTFNFSATAPTFTFNKPPTPEKGDDEEEEGMPEEPRTNDALIAGPGEGEENETQTYSAPRSKIYKFDEAEKKFKDLGICAVKINKNESGVSRIIARAEGSGAIRLNARIYPHLTYNLESKNNVKCPAYETVDGKDPKVFHYLFKFREPTDASAFAEAINASK